MRKVRKNLNDVPNIFKSKSVLDSIELIAQGNANLISDKIYKDSYKKNGKTESRVRDHLNKYYHEKCAYCETIVKAEIEHYRPKLGVIEDSTHNGYYWLCYEWSNLVPSCRYCNTEGGKGNKFPIMGKRVRNPNFKSNRKLDKNKCLVKNSPLINENPYLLHPEVDNPKKYFRFQIKGDKTGIDIYGKDKKGRGTKTIEICNLNRWDLSRVRFQRVLYSIKQDINTAFTRNALKKISKKQLLKELKRIFDYLVNDAKNIYIEYCLLRWFLVSNVKNFTACITPYLSDDNQRLILIDAFKKYKNGKL